MSLQEDDFPDSDHEDENDNETFYSTENILNEKDIIWAIKKQGMILERDRKALPSNKKLAIHRLLQSITRIDYQCLNKPIEWEDDEGVHTGFYHPMDLRHFIIKNLDITSRSELYQKLSVCKLALPVLFPKNDPVYMDVSLRQVKIIWKNNGHRLESDVTGAPILLISMIRRGQQSPGSFSKSKLAIVMQNLVAVDFTRKIHYQVIT